MKRKTLMFTAGALCGLFVISLAGCGGGGSSSTWYDKDMWMTAGSSLPTEAVSLPTSAALNTVSVHDPSVFYDEDTGLYYAFGTHYATASSEDLVTWTQLSSDGAYSFLYGSEVYNYNGVNWPAALQTTIDTVEPASTITTTWAPSVTCINGTYYMYYSVTSAFGSNKSAIGRVSSDSVTGPYENNEVLLFSDGTSSSAPNCIDPEVFYDKDGKLWMVYGSFFGGVYIVELNASGSRVGLPVSESTSEYGTLIWKKGYSAGVEGPFIFYNAETDYYYLMVSEGDLESTYNMRVARSKDPDGPYVDISDKDVSNSTVTGGTGVKLAGNYKFSSDSANNVALGHNSVIKVDGKYLIVCHVRTAVSGGHHVEVRQLYFNEDGWPVMSANRYAGEEKGLVTQSEAAGNYDVIVHSTDTTSTIVSSENYTFSADGAITDSSGASAGTWSVTSDYYVTITLNGVEYNGVIIPGWRNYGTKQGILSMTATSDDGNPIWANSSD